MGTCRFFPVLFSFKKEKSVPAIIVLSGQEPLFFILSFLLFYIFTLFYATNESMLPSTFPVGILLPVYQTDTIQSWEQQVQKVGG